MYFEAGTEVVVTSFAGDNADRRFAVKTKEGVTLPERGFAEVTVTEWTTISKVHLQSKIDMKRVPGNPMISSKPKAIDEMRKIVNKYTGFTWSESQKEEKKLYELESGISNPTKNGLLCLYIVSVESFH